MFYICQIISILRTTIVVTINVELNIPLRAAGSMVKLAPCSRDHDPTFENKRVYQSQ